MHRRNFIKNSCLACMGIISLPVLMESCATVSHFTANIEGNFLIIPITAFQFLKNNETKYKNYIIVQNNALQFPICVYRIDEKNYSALWMRCTHQGAELQVFGDRLQCPAHGSEFDKKGNVKNDPATQNLKTFPVIIEENQIKISLS